MQAADVKASPYEPGVYFVKDQSWQASMGCTLDCMVQLWLDSTQFLAGWGEIQALQAPWHGILFLCVPGGGH